MEIALVVPLYNEENSIRYVVKAALRYVKNIVVVNDHSTDNSLKVLEKLPVRVINNTTNLGYSKTLEKGIGAAFRTGADYVITFDADGQHRAIDLKKFVSVIEKKRPSLVLGKRSFKNRLMERIFGVYAKLRYGFSDPLCGMKAYKKSLFEKYGCLERKYSIGTELTFRAVADNSRFIEVAIKSEKRRGDSRFAGNLTGNLLELKALFNILFI